MKVNELKEKFNFLKTRKYEKSNHPGIKVFYDKQTFLKIEKKTKITITPGNVLFILTDCLFSENKTDNKIFIRSGNSEEALI